MPRYINAEKERRKLIMAQKNENAVYTVVVPANSGTEAKAVCNGEKERLSFVQKNASCVDREIAEGKLLIRVQYGVMLGLPRNGRATALFLCPDKYGDIYGNALIVKGEINKNKCNQKYIYFTADEAKSIAAEINNNQGGTANEH